MKSLFLPSSLKILESLSFTRSLFAFDFDGTLSKIVPVPSDARITPAVNLLLKNLAQFAPVAIISGRSIQDLKDHLEFVPHYLVGNHGLEGLETRSGSMSTAQKACRLWCRELEKALSDKTCDPGLEIEDKVYSLAVHYRRCKSKKNAKIRVLQTASALNPQPRIILGKCVVNILPPGAPHKGVALMELMLQANARSAFYVGDDDTDEDVFTLPNSRILTARVGNKSTSQAQYFIRDQSEVERLLKTLIRFYQLTPKKLARSPVQHERL